MNSQPTQDNHINQLDTRRYDLDHLRVYAFGLLIFYHTAMLYTPNWGFHIKSDYHNDWIESLMLLVNPWRMALIWIISGIATHFLLNKLSSFTFLITRSIRLLLPLTFGILFIVPFQLYFEMKANGDMNLSLWQFWQIFFDLDNPVFVKYQSGILPHIDVNHLWYLRALWPFTLILLVISPLLNSQVVSKLLEKCGFVFGRFSILIFPIGLLFLFDLLVFSGLEGDSQRHAEGFAFFILGYLLTGQSALWLSLKNIRRISLMLALVSYASLVYGYQTYYLQPEGFTNDYLKVLFSLIYQADVWFFLAAIFGYAFAYLNKPNRLIKILNPAVYPTYLLHQTLIISFAYPLIQLKLGGFVEALLILTATFVGCAVIYLIVSKTYLLRPFFGLKIPPMDFKFLSPIFQKPIFYRSLASLMVLPIALPIFIWFFGLG